MKKVILMLFVLCMLTGCGKKEALEPDITDTVSESEKTTQPSEEQERFVWDKKEELVVNQIKEETVQVPNGLVEENAGELKTYFTDVTGDGNKDCICIYKTDNKYRIKVYDYGTDKEVEVFDKDMSFTNKQESRLADIFDDWFEKRFDKEVRPNYTRNGFDSVLESSFEYSVVQCNGENMICVSYLTKEMEKVEKMGDRMTVLLKYSEGEFAVYDVWLSYKFKYMNTFAGGQ